MGGNVYGQFDVEVAGKKTTTQLIEGPDGIMAVVVKEDVPAAAGPGEAAETAPESNGEVE